VNISLTAAVALKPVDPGRISHTLKPSRAFSVAFPGNSSPPWFEHYTFGNIAITL